jgi:hypothetical protein
MGDTVPEIVTKHPELKKYWDLRHTLFTKYDEGIQLDYGKGDMYSSLSFIY